jgi:hypothetical protein
MTKAPTPLFDSFWLAGFESACHINRAGRRLDMIASTQHDVQADVDYARLAEVGIRAARDGVRWHLVDRGGGRYDFSSLAPRAGAARRHGVQVIWTLCHYGWPDGLDVFAPAFVGRFARYCAAVARYLADHSDDVPFYTPVNEISFLAWAVGHRGMIHPFALGRDQELKRQLVRAAVAGCEAVWAVNPRARFVHGDPVIHVVPPRGRPDLADAATRQRAAQFDAWDMLAGRLHPELGGHPRYLDIVAVHYYHANQWEHPDVRLRWEDTPRDERWVPLHRLLAEVYERYRRPFLMGETSHFGGGGSGLPGGSFGADPAPGARRSLGPGLGRRGSVSPLPWRGTGSPGSTGPGSSGGGPGTGGGGSLTGGRPGSGLEASVVMAVPCGVRAAAL